MREVISNTSPLQYLYQAELLDLLPALYGTVVVPGGVTGLELVALLEQAARHAARGRMVIGRITPWVDVIYP